MNHEAAWTPAGIDPAVVAFSRAMLDFAEDATGPPSREHRYRLGGLTVALECGRPSEAKLPFPAPSGWLRTDVALPDGFPASGPPRKLSISGRILHARARAPIRYRLYCGSVRLGAGRTLPIPAGGRGGFHAFRISAELDPAIVAAEGQAALSLYFGRRSRAAGVLGRDAVIQVTRLR